VENNRPFGLIIGSDVKTVFIDFMVDFFGVIAEKQIFLTGLATP
jgi:hypothetical protein